MTDNGQVLAFMAHPDDIELLCAEDAAILGCDVGTPFLRTRRLTRRADGRPIEFVTSLLNPAHFALHLEF